MQTMEQLIKEVRTWRGDVLIGFPSDQGMLHIKVVKSDLLGALERQKLWAKQPPFEFRIVGSTGYIEYKGIPMQGSEPEKPTPAAKGAPATKKAQPVKRSSTAKKKVGRPPGSKNKPKVASSVGSQR